MHWSFRADRARNILEIDPDTLCTLTVAAQRIAKAQVAVLSPDGVQIMQFNGGKGGQSVYHIHFHIIPRWDGQSLGLHVQVRGDDAEIAHLARLLAAQLKTD
jgi:histidine triad (HIT) family protein